MPSQPVRLSQGEKTSDQLYQMFSLFLSLSLSLSLPLSPSTHPHPLPPPFFSAFIPPFLLFLTHWHLNFYWFSCTTHMFLFFPREDKRSGVPDACRVHGSLEVSKVAGNFHITAGKWVKVFSAFPAWLWAEWLRYWNMGRGSLDLNLSLDGVCRVTCICSFLLYILHPLHHLSSCKQQEV